MNSVHDESSDSLQQEEVEHYGNESDHTSSDESDKGCVQDDQEKGYETIFDRRFPPTDPEDQAAKSRNAAICSQLPLLPGKYLHVPFKVMEMKALEGVDITVVYSERPTSHLQRRFQQSLLFGEGRDGIRVTKLETFPFEPPSKKVVTSTAVGLDITNQIVEPKATITDLGHNSSASDSETMAQFDGVGGLKPEGNDSLDCMLVLQLENTAETSFRIYCEIDGVSSGTEALVAKKSDARVVLTVKRLSFGWRDDEALRRMVMTPTSQHTAAQKNIFVQKRAEFRKRFKLRWVTGDGTRGSLNDLERHITPDVLVGLLTEPFSFAYSLPPTTIVPGSGLTRADVQVPDLNKKENAPTNQYPVGEFHSFYFHITNKSEEAAALELTIEPHQETANGCLDNDLKHKLIWIGSLVTKLPTLQAGHIYTHELKVCFISTGRYGFRASCRKLSATTRKQTHTDRQRYSHCKPTDSGDKNTSGSKVLNRRQPIANDTSRRESSLVYWSNYPLVVETVKLLQVH